jgi:hypothetical protein
MSDYDNDGYVGFEIVEAREIDTIGTAGIIKKIHDRVGELLQCLLQGTPDPNSSSQASTLLSTSRSTSTRLIQPLLLLLVHPRPVDGRLARSALSSEGLRASTLLPRILSKSLLRMTPMQSSLL